jgi:hypothetical protein
MKSLFFLLMMASLLACNSPKSEHSLTKLWETDTLLKTPESVYFDGNNQVLYVSNINGTDPWAMDGNGSIGKVGLDGKIIAVDWVTGLNSPKGIGVLNGKLYVADVTGVAVIDIQKGAIEKRIEVSDSAGLNDLSVGSDGVVWVSDSKNKRIYRIENDQPEIYLDSLQGPNGVLMHDDALYFLDAGTAYKTNPDRSLVKLADSMDESTDGIENVGANDFIVSCWMGVIYYVNGSGEKQMLLDTRKEKINAADIGFDAGKKIVYVPTFWKNAVVAYQLN